MEECQATLADICKHAREHYGRVTKEVCEWGNTIPAMIDFYEQNYKKDDIKTNLWLAIDIIIKENPIKDNKEAYTNRWNSLINYILKEV